MSWGQPEEVPVQQAGWGTTQVESSWGNTDQQQGGWGSNQGEQKEGNWGSSNNEQKKEDGGQRGGGRGRGRGRGGRGGRGGRDRGGQERQGGEGNTHGQEQGGGWYQPQQTENGNTTEGGWGATNLGETKTDGQGWGNQENVNNNNSLEEGERRGKGKRHESPPPVKRMRPNPIVIVVEDNEDSETQHIIIQEYPILKEKQKGLIVQQESQICYEGNIKIEDCNITAKFISYDTSSQTKINGLDAYTYENAKEYLKQIGEKVVVGIVEGPDAENQKALNKLADNLVEKQQAICFQQNKVNLFSVKQLYKVDTKSRLAFVIQI